MLHLTSWNYINLSVSTLSWSWCDSTLRKILLRHLLIRIHSILKENIREQKYLIVSNTFHIVVDYQSLHVYVGYQARLSHSRFLTCALRKFSWKIMHAQFRQAVSSRVLGNRIEAGFNRGIKRAAYAILVGEWHSCNHGGSRGPSLIEISFDIDVLRSLSCGISAPSSGIAILYRCAKASAWSSSAIRVISRYESTYGSSSSSSESSRVN